MDFHSVDCRRGSTVLTIYFYKLLARDLSSCSTHVFSSLLGPRPAFAWMHARVAWSAHTGTGIDLEPLYFTFQSSVSLFERLTPSTTTTACFQGGISPFVLCFRGTREQWSPSLSLFFVGFRYSGRGRTLNSKARSVSDLWGLVVALTHHRACSSVSVVVTTGVSRGPILWDAVLPLKESSLKKIQLWKSILIISLLGDDLREAFKY